MMNLGAILKMVGIKVPAQTVEQIEAILPKVPEIVRQSIATVNGALKNYDDRLARIEATQLQILEELQNGRDDSNIRYAGVGATQRRLESIGFDGAD